MHKPIVPVLSEENSEKLISKPVNQQAIQKMLRISDKIRNHERTYADNINNECDTLY